MFDYQRVYQSLPFFATSITIPVGLFEHSPLYRGYLQIACKNCGFDAVLHCATLLFRHNQPINQAC